MQRSLFAIKQKSAEKTPALVSQGSAPTPPEGKQNKERSVADWSNDEFKQVHQQNKEHTAKLRTDLANYTAKVARLDKEVKALQKEEAALDDKLWDEDMEEKLAKKELKEAQEKLEALLPKEQKLTADIENLKQQGKHAEAETMGNALRQLQADKKFTLETRDNIISFIPHIGGSKQIGGRLQEIGKRKGIIRAKLTNNKNEQMKKTAARDKIDSYAKTLKEKLARMKGRLQQLAQEEARRFAMHTSLTSAEGSAQVVSFPLPKMVQDEKVASPTREDAKPALASQDAAVPPKQKPEKAKSPLPFTGTELNEPRTSFSLVRKYKAQESKNEPSYDWLQTRKKHREQQKTRGILSSHATCIISYNSLARPSLEAAEQAPQPGKKRKLGLS